MVRTIRVVGAAILDGARVLAARRPPEGPAGGLWEFPGGKIEAGESPEQALEREIAEELGVRIEIDERAGTGTAFVGKTRSERVVLSVYFARLVAGAPEAREHVELRWLRAHGIAKLTWAAADRPVLAAVVDRLKRP